MTVKNTTSIRDDLLVALIEVGRLFPDWQLASILAYLARTAGYGHYGEAFCLTDSEALGAARRLAELNAERQAKEPSQPLLSYVSQQEVKAISNQEDLERYLRIELGYCGCAHGDEAIELLQDVLRIARERQLSLATPDPMVGCTHAYQQLMARVRCSEVPGLATWFLYLLDSRGLIEHNSNVTECAITDRGSRLLNAIERYWLPSNSEPSAPVVD